MSKQSERHHSDTLVEKLIIAISACDIQAVKELVQQGVNVNSKLYSLSPLTYAIMKGHAKIVLALIENGADIEAKAEDGSTPLIYAISKGHANIVLELIKYGVDISIGYKGFSPMELARSFGYDKIITLIEAAPVINLLYLHPPKGDSSLSTAELKLLKDKLNKMSFAELQEIYSVKNITDNTFVSYKKYLMNLVDAETSKEVDQVFRELTNKNILFVDILRSLKTYRSEDTKNYTELNKTYQEIIKLIDAPLDYILAQLKECNKIIENIKLDFAAGKEEAAKCLEYIAQQYFEIERLKLPDFENLKEGIVALNIDFNYEEVPQTIEEPLANSNVGALQHTDEVVPNVVSDNEPTEMCSPKPPLDNDPVTQLRKLYENRMSPSNKKELETISSLDCEGLAHYITKGKIGEFGEATSTVFTVNIDSITHKPYTCYKIWQPRPPWYPKEEGEWGMVHYFIHLENGVYISKNGLGPIRTFDSYQKMLEVDAFPPRGGPISYKTANYGDTDDIKQALIGESIVCPMEMD